MNTENKPILPTNVEKLNPFHRKKTLEKGSHYECKNE